MRTQIFLESMESEQRRRPDLFSIRHCAEMGPFLILNVAPYDPVMNERYPGWRQSRVYNGHIIEIEGSDWEPSRYVIDMWNTIDRDFEYFSEKCIESTNVFVNNELHRTLPVSYRTCLDAISTAIRTMTMYVSGVMFGQSDIYSVILGYPGSDEFYMWPKISFQEHVITYTIVTE